MVFFPELHHFYHGVRDAVAIPTSVYVIYQSKQLQRLAYQAFLLNGVIFLGSFVSFSYIVLPFLRDFFNLDAIHRSGSPHLLLSALDSLVTSSYYLFWVLPVYLISFILSTVWYSELASISFKLQVGQPPKSAQSFLERLTDEIYRAVLVTVFLIQGMVFYLVPVVGELFVFIHVAWLYAFYCFEYKWSLLGWNLKEKIAFFEMHWIYMCGFGVPFAALSFFFPSTFVNNGMFVLVYPLFIILSNSAVPLPCSHSERTIANLKGPAMPHIEVADEDERCLENPPTYLPLRFPLFRYSEKMTSGVIALLSSLKTKKKN
eukprot:GCRY01004116.1.p1 GENE.GCRY01004116.1~~GCRY01004116.1.p1  ORF type:complete len:317 (+),score=35.64 GCRY01004116.1:157-1107(+)